MRIVRTNILPLVKRYDAINLFGVLFVHHGVSLSPSLLNHEAIHSRQMVELLVVPFYLAYLLEWLVRLPLNGFSAHRAYASISFEREAYKYQNQLDYLSRRRVFAQWRRRL